MRISPPLLRLDARGDLSKVFCRCRSPWQLAEPRVSRRRAEEFGSRSRATRAKRRRYSKLVNESGVTFRNIRFRKAYRGLLWATLGLGVSILFLPGEARGIAIFLAWCTALAALYMWWWSENSRVTVAPCGLTAGDYEGIRRTVRWDEILSVSPQGRVVTLQKTSDVFFMATGNDLFVAAGILESPSFQKEVLAMAYPNDVFSELFRTL